MGTVNVAFPAGLPDLADFLARWSRRFFFAACFCPRVLRLPLTALLHGLVIPDDTYSLSTYSHRSPEVAGMRDDEIQSEFGRRVRRARQAVGLSQEELAHRSGLHRTYVGSVERGERNIGLLNITALATVLDVDASIFVDGLWRAPAEDTW